ncbi:HD-GYP domain-containing protein [Bacteriovoracaceae bacterium]|nr:HD-GYP domain-containing protein [Bacteriovoracaceae bacterium]
MKKKSNLIKFPKAERTAVSFVSILQLSKKVQDLEEKNKEIAEMSIRTILQALEAKDHYTYGHSMRVTYYALVVGRELGLDNSQLYDLEISSLFHDVGKIGIPDHILNKPSRLEEDEFKIMKKHPEMSAEILKGFDVFEQAALNAKHHHERFDGRGYPAGMKGEEIPIYSRIILIADTFDAMTSTRVYRKGLPYSVAFEELMQFSGSQFDENLVKAFIRGMRNEEKKGEKDFHIPIMGQDFKKDAA